MESETYIPDIVVSPCHKSSITLVDNKVQCTKCGQEYPIVDGIIDFILEEYLHSRKLKKWRILSEKYKERDNRKINDDEKRDLYFRYHNEFITTFCALHGKMLDIGCGPMLNHMKIFNKDLLPKIEYFGIDPELELFQGNSNCFRGVGEFLPFLDESFDAAIMISVIDHVFYPKKVMAEAYRVLKDKGFLYISCPMRHVTWKTELRKIVDKRFRANKHITDFNEPRLLKLISSTAFILARKQKSVESPKNLFLALKK